MNVIVITGASSGMGKDFAKAFDKMYDNVMFYLVARRENLLENLQKELKNESIILPYDLTLEEDLIKYQNVLKDNNPNVLFLVNSAGFGKFGTYKDISLEVSLKMIDINVKALVTVTLNTLPYMSEGSRIINLGSASSFFPLKNFNVYASTKAFVVHYSNALHDELKPRKISCTVVCPGWVKTEFFDVCENNTVGPKKYKPMLKSSKVVQKAIEASLKNKKFCVYNYFTKFHRFASRFFPRWIVLKMWSNMQRKV